MTQAHVIGALTEGFRGDFLNARRACDHAEILARELSFPALGASAKIIGAWARAKIGETSGAVEAIRAGIAEARATRTFTGSGLALFLLAETQSLDGVIDDAVNTVHRALLVSPDELNFRPLSLHLRGQLHLRDGAGVAPQSELAESDFREAIELSRRMSARSPELRATTSLARLLRDTGRRDEARAMLSEIYGWFTEGFETRDLIEAKALLEELSG
jgi:predicted ATPase